MIFAVMMGWVLSRSDTFAGAGHFFAALVGAGHVLQAQPWHRYAGNEVIWALCLGAAFSLPLWNAAKNAGAKIGERVPAAGRELYFGFGQLLEILLIVAVLLIAAAWLAGGTYNPFIYFRF